VYILFHAAEEIKNNRRSVGVIIALAGAVGLVVFMDLFQPIQDIISTLLLSRFPMII
jgi:hypothetical protein